MKRIIFLIVLIIFCHKLSAQIIVPLDYIDMKAEANIYFELKDYENALSIYTDILKGDFIRRIDYVYLTKCCVEIGKLELAKKIFNIGLDSGIHFKNLKDTIFCYDTTNNYYFNFLTQENWNPEKKKFIDNTKKYFDNYITEKELAKKLIIKYNTDVKLETFAKKYPYLDSVNFSKLNIRKENQLYLENIITEKGFPTIQKVGEEACFSAFKIIENSEHDIDFQEYCLKIMIQEYKNSEIPSTYIAILQDKILLARGKKQIFGTQLTNKNAKKKVRNIKDKEKLEKRQKVMLVFNF